MKIYVIHYDKLVDRKDVLEEKLTQNGLSAEWLIQSGYYDQTFIDKYYEYNKKEWKRKVKIANRPIIYRPLIKSEVHLTINHFLIGEKIIRSNEEYKYRINLLGLKTVWAVPPLVKQSSLDESNSTNSGQDQRDKEGLKKYIYWRQNIYKLFPKKFKKKIYKLEEKVKKIMLGIK